MVLLQQTHLLLVQVQTQQMWQVQNKIVLLKIKVPLVHQDKMAPTLLMQHQVLVLQEQQPAPKIEVETYLLPRLHNQPLRILILMQTVQSDIT
jgi:hypothetical protein